MHGVDVSYGSVRDYVRARRPEIEIEAGQRVIEAFVPQEHAPGAEAEVAFGEVWVVLAGVKPAIPWEGMNRSVHDFRSETGSYRRRSVVRR